MTENRETIRIAAVGDLHRERNDGVGYRELFARAEDDADVLLLCGDLTDYGRAEEAKPLAAELLQARIPVLAVLGNHDYEAGQQDQIVQILADAGVLVLDGQSTEIKGVGFAGAKGFGGGFGVHTLEPWGESAVKQFVQHALDESMKLELALSRLRTACRVALLHYSPVRATVEGEPPEIHAYLGSSRLEEPINRYRVAAVFHGHAHRGTLEGRTRENIPVYNVSHPLLRDQLPGSLPVRFVTLPIHSGSVEAPSDRVADQTPMFTG